MRENKETNDFGSRRSFTNDLSYEMNIVHAYDSDIFRAEPQPRLCYDLKIVHRSKQRMGKVEGVDSNRSRVEAVPL